MNKTVKYLILTIQLAFAVSCLSAQQTNDTVKAFYGLSQNDVCIS